MARGKVWAEYLFCRVATWAKRIGLALGPGAMIFGVANSDWPLAVAGGIPTVSAIASRRKRVTCPLPPWHDASPESRSDHV